VSYDKSGCGEARYSIPSETPAAAAISRTDSRSGKASIAAGTATSTVWLPAVRMANLYNEPASTDLISQLTFFFVG
jgi:hypothetical protein